MCRKPRGLSLDGDLSSSPIILAVGSPSSHLLCLRLSLCHLSDDDAREALFSPRGAAGWGAKSGPLWSLLSSRPGIDREIVILAEMRRHANDINHTILSVSLPASVQPLFSLCLSFFHSEFSKKNCLLAPQSRRSNWLQKGTCTASEPSSGHRKEKVKNHLTDQEKKQKREFKSLYL